MMNNEEVRKILGGKARFSEAEIDLLRLRLYEWAEVVGHRAFSEGEKCWGLVSQSCQWNCRCQGNLSRRMAGSFQDKALSRCIGRAGGPMRAIIYCRVSTKEQVSNQSLHTQQKACT